MTYMDASSPQRILELVLMLERGDGADALAERMERLLTTFLPTEATLRRLSLFQQEALGGAQEYAITLMFALAMEQAPLLLQQRQIRRRHSWPSNGRPSNGRPKSMPSSPETAASMVLGVDTL